MVGRGEEAFGGLFLKNCSFVQCWQESTFPSGDDELSVVLVKKKTKHKKPVVSTIKPVTY